MLVAATLIKVKSPGDEKQSHPWQIFGLVGALLLSSWSVFLQRWTYNNALLTACAGLGLVVGLGMGWAIGLAGRLSRRPLNSVMLAVIPILLIGQFLALYYHPAEQVPTAKDKEAGEQFISYLSELSGEVLVFDHGFMNYLAGKSTYFHSSAYADAVGNGSYPPRTEDNGRRRAQVHQVVDQAISQQHFDWVIVDEPATSWLPAYIYVGSFFSDPEVFYPATGSQSRPESLMARNSESQGGDISPLQFAAVERIPP